MTSVLNEIDFEANFLADNYINLESPARDDLIYDSTLFNRTFPADNSTSSLAILQLNIRSLPRNGNCLVAFLETLGRKFDIICLNETWLNENRFIEDLFPNYNAYHSMRPSQMPPGGGVSIYISKTLSASLIHEHTLNQSHIESVFVNIILSGNRSLIVGSCYRRPDSTNAHDFILTLNRIIHALDPTPIKIIGGDFNFNFFNINEDTTTSSFVDTMLSSGLLHSITKPTREVGNSISLLDNIFVSNYIPFTSGTLFWDISDHYPVFTILDEILRNEHQTETIRFRLLKDDNIDNFVHELSEHDFLDVLDCTDIDEAIDLFDLKVTELLNRHCPIITKQITWKDRAKPWVNSHLKHLIKKRHSYFNKLKRNRVTPEFYRFFRNYVNKKLTDSKLEFFSRQLNQVKGNMKRTWNIINGLLKPCTNRKMPNIRSLLINNQQIFGNDQISNSLNQHFSTIGSTISNSFPGTSNRASPSRTIPNSLFFRPCTANDVDSIIRRMKNSSNNIDSYSPKILKLISNIVSPIIASLINKSLLSGYFPNKFKVARVVALHKGGSKEELGNYRPISLLPTLSKVFERFVYNQLYEFLEKFNILTPKQFGFRKGKSTVQAVMDQLKFVYDNLDLGNTVVSIFMDFSKAFDCLDHTILLYKLSCYGIRGLALNWFESYLSDRLQYTNVNNCNSPLAPVTHGVPQGSILGPLLFLLFINDLPTANDFFEPTLFADDSTLTCAFDNSNETLIKHKLESELNIIHQWLSANKIQVNYSKSKFMIFSYGKTYNLEELAFGNSSISVASEMKFLGITIDRNLNFKSHTAMISSKISKATGILFRLNNILPQSALKSLYDALVVPHLLYGLEIWYSTLQCNQDRIFKLQKKSIRAIRNLGYNEHTSSHFQILGSLKLDDLYKLRLLTFMYINKNLFATNSDIHPHLTRHRNDMLLPHFRRARSQSSWMYQGATLWNNLPANLKALNTVGIFKSNIKLLALNNY